MDHKNLSARFGADSYPLYVLIDRDGNMVEKQEGSRGERALRGLLGEVGLE
jgi:hypothetical protein